VGALRQIRRGPRNKAVGAGIRARPREDNYEAILSGQYFRRVSDAPDICS